MPVYSDVPRAAKAAGALRMKTQEELAAINLKAALELAAGGIPIFPAALSWNPETKKFAKKPIVDGWQANASTDPQVIERWWQDYPHAVPGIQLGKAGLIVVDLDRHEGGPNGVEAFKTLLSGRTIEPTPQSKTASNGYHLVFRQPDGEPLGNRTGALPKGIDVRGEGGWVVAPGATANEGMWCGIDSKPSLAQAYKDNTIPVIPDFLEAIIRAPKKREDNTAPSMNGSGRSGERESKYAEAALRNMADEIAATRAGGRNEALNKAAFCMGTMIAAGWIGESTVRGRLEDAMRTNGYIADKGIAAVRDTLNSGIGAGLKTPHEPLKDRDGYGPSAKSGKASEGPGRGAQAQPEPPTPLTRELPPADPFPVDALGEILGPAAIGIHDRI